MNLSQTESAIGLFAYHKEDPDASLYAQFYSLVLDWLAKLRVEPTYIGPSGEGYPEKYLKFGGNAHKRAVDAGFQNINGLSIAANPPGSNAPAYDSFFESVISYIPTSGFPQSAGGVVYLYFVINESFLLFGSEGFERVLKELIDLYPWDFGMGFNDTAERHPEYHIGSLGHDKLTADEREAGQTWYDTPPEVRVVKLRSIYPYNIVNDQQLSHPIKPDLSLKDFIEREGVGTLEALSGSRLWLWKVPKHEQRVALRRQLHWKVPDWRSLSRGQIDWSQPGIVIDSATLIP